MHVSSASVNKGVNKIVRVTNYNVHILGLIVGFSSSIVGHGSSVFFNFMLLSIFDGSANAIAVHCSLHLSVFNFYISMLCNDLARNLGLIIFCGTFAKAVLLQDKKCCINEPVMLCCCSLFQSYWTSQGLGHVWYVVLSMTGRE